MSSPVLAMSPLVAPPWTTEDPFLFCMHHRDNYPRGNDTLGPAASLAGRDIGQDFDAKNAWRMYHGRTVPGFPAHPHRGFETVTIVLRGFVDHADSLGASARYGNGDVQWLTAGAGISHSEMFPLLDRANPNPLELFQIWLNLPAADKLAGAHFTMFWSQDIPRRSFNDEAGRTAQITIVAGSLEDTRALPPPPHSWASRKESEVAIWMIGLQARAIWTMPPATSEGTVRTLYFFRGPGVRVSGARIEVPSAIRMRADAPARIEAGEGDCELLLLQGRPIGEPVVQYGPFVMNSRAQIEAAFADYRRTRFGGWPWPSDAPVFARDAGRFANPSDARNRGAR